MADSVDAITLLHDDDEEPQVSLKRALSNRKLWKVCMYGMSIVFAFRFPAIVMPILGAKYFEAHGHDDGNATYAMYFSLFSCLGGLFGFCFESFLGELSDKFGRKKIMYFTWFCFFIGNASMCLTDNVWFYLILTPVTSLSGAFSGIPTVLTAALSDCVVPKYKTTIFAILFGIAGIVAIIGSVATALVTSYFSIKASFFAFAITMFIALIWLIFIMEETLPPNDNDSESKKVNLSYNPFRPLYRMKENKVIFWVSLMALFAAIPESGINDMVSSYTDDILSISDDDSKAAQFNALSGITMGIIMLISQLFILPIFTTYFKFGDVTLFVIVLFAIFLFMCSGIICYLFPSYFTGLLIWGCFGLSFITSPVVNGSLAKRLNENEQGLGMGILHSMKGLTFATAPYAFGGLYDLFNNHGILKTMPFMLGIMFVLLGIVVLFGPSKKTLNQYDAKISNESITEKLIVNNVN